jgi:hypothetical protein
MILQTGGLASGATSTKSRLLFSESSRPSFLLTIPTCLPSKSISLIFSALIFSFILNFGVDLIPIFLLYAD